ncbi:MAG: MGMT family protein [Firmicutes bacterium]|nr:MGMT family protein [Bacillota bacterium]
MTKAEYDGFKLRIYEIVSRIPEGRVLTYGALAMLAGRPGNARLAGKVMSEAPRDARSHRVVSAAGRTVPGWENQRELLEREGVGFRANGRVDMRKCLWRSG